MAISGSNMATSVSQKSFVGTGSKPCPKGDVILAWPISQTQLMKVILQCISIVSFGCFLLTKNEQY